MRIARPGPSGCVLARQPEWTDEDPPGSARAREPQGRGDEDDGIGFRADVETCAHCGGPMRWVDAAATRKSAARLLAKLGLGPQPPPEPVRAVPGQLRLPFGK
jgi:hypothetical protein